MSARGSRLLAAAAAVSLALAPAIADARLGGGGSMGSRGSQTWSAPPSTRTAPSTAQPMERSVTPSAPMGQSPMGARPGMAPQMMPQRSGFMSGLMGGLIGAGIGGMLFGGGFFGHGLGFGGLLGFLFQAFLIIIIGRWVFRRFFSGGQPATAGAPNIFARGNAGLGPNPNQSGSGGSGLGGMMGGLMGGGSARPSAGPPPVAISPQDFQQFEQLLQAMQAAWSARDLNALRGMSSPEMASYFAEQLADQTSRGVTNTTSDVRLESGDLSQAWSENGRDYATVAMRFSMIDITKDGLGHVVDGSPTERVTATEVWTFVRATGGGHWILSAIQQTR